jgi:hypothetical protein
MCTRTWVFVLRKSSDARSLVIALANVEKSPERKGRKPWIDPRRGN